MSTKSKLNIHSALLWLPQLAELACLVPTIEIQVSDGDPVAAIEEAVSQVGSPAFVRGDMTSTWLTAGPEGFKVEGCARAAYRLIEADTHAKGFALTSLLVRRWIDCGIGISFDNGSPIPLEVHVLACPTEARCLHFIWDEANLPHKLQRAPTTEEWKAVSTARRSITAKDRAFLERNARKASELCAPLGEDLWSSQFIRDQDGRWWLIELERHEAAWHPATCPKG